jgi:hypothetical protein
MPQTVAAISLKMTMPKILKRFGYRWVLLSNTVFLGGAMALFSTIGPGTQVATIVAQAFALGFFSSLQYTSMNTLAYADVPATQTSMASTIASTMQQMSMSFGVAAASLTAAVFLPSRERPDVAEMILGIHRALLVLGGLTVVSAGVFRGLRPGDGDNVSMHRGGVTGE